MKEICGVSTQKYADSDFEIHKFLSQNQRISLEFAVFNEIHIHLSDLNRETSNNERPLA